jgi:hypothetical protein
MAQESSAERILAEWEETRQQVRKLHLRLQTAQEQLKLLERHPWLGSVKGVLRKKDGGAFDIPEGPRVARVSPPPPRTNQRRRDPGRRGHPRGRTNPPRRTGSEKPRPFCRRQGGKPRQKGKGCRPPLPLLPLLRRS